MDVLKQPGQLPCTQRYLRGKAFHTVELKARGVTKSAYRRARDPHRRLRERVDASLPIAIENAATLEFDEIYEI
jgi:hypothetical protein